VEEADVKAPTRAVECVRVIVFLILGVGMTIAWMGALAYAANFVIQHL
jgi:hypothetical protein